MTKSAVPAPEICCDATPVLAVMRAILRFSLRFCKLRQSDDGTFSSDRGSWNPFGSRSCPVGLGDIPITPGNMRRRQPFMTDNE